MKIEIANLGFLYNLLYELPNRNVDSSDFWKGGEEDSPPLKRMGGVKFDPCELPRPLHFVGLLVTRRGELYAAEYYIRAKDKVAFEGLSDKLREQLRGMGRGWSPIASDGSGYIFCGPDNPKIILTMAAREEEVRIIGLGTNGAVPRKLSRMEDFIDKITELGQIGTMVVNSCLPETTPKDLTLHLNF